MRVKFEATDTAGKVHKRSSTSRVYSHCVVIYFAAHPPSKLWPKGVPACSHAEWWEAVRWPSAKPAAGARNRLSRPSRSLRRGKCPPWLRRTNVWRRTTSLGQRAKLLMNDRAPIRSAPRGRLRCNNVGLERPTSGDIKVMPTILSRMSTFAAAADQIDYWIRRHLIEYWDETHPSQLNLNPDRDKRVGLSALGHAVRTSRAHQEI
jgi:hypothetical protein